MRNKSRKKNQTSVQQTCCVSGKLKDLLKGSIKIFITLLIKEIVSEVFHSEGLASLWSLVKQCFRWRP